MPNFEKDESSSMAQLAKFLVIAACAVAIFGLIVFIACSCNA